MKRRKLVRVEVPSWTVSRREVPNSQGGVRQHLLLRRRAGERNGNRDFYLARKAVRRADRFLSTVPVSLREHHQQREVGACKRVGPKAATGRSFQSQELGDTRGKRIRKTGTNYGLSTSSSTLTITRNMVTELYHTQKGVHEPPYFSTMLVGSKNTLIYNLDVSLISDFIDSLMTESMIEAALGTAETVDDDLSGELELCSSTMA